MFGTVTFHSNPYFGYSPTVSYFSLYPLRICYAARCVHFPIPSGRAGAPLFLREQSYASGSAFIKNIKPFVCHYTSIYRQYTKKQDCKTNCFVIGPPSVEF